MSDRTRGARAITERGFHRWLATHLAAGREGPLPLGDDAAALRPPRGRVAVVTTDSLVEGTHFPATSPPYRVGQAAVAVSFSDIAAKGARPAGVLLTFLLPPGTPARWAQSVARGAEAMARAHGARIVGGDTKPAPRAAIASTVVGWGRERTLAPRHRATVGDGVYITGTVGRGGAAFRDFTRPRHPSRRTLRALLDVRPRLREGQVLAPRAHAMLDTSDGLAEAAHLLARASHVKVVLEADRIPWDRALGRPRPTDRAWRAIAFYGGDYELLLTASIARGARFARLARRIGRVEAGRGAFLALGGRDLPLPRAGWQPFDGPPRTMRPRPPRHDDMP